MSSPQKLTCGGIFLFGICLGFFLSPARNDVSRQIASRTAQPTSNLSQKETSSHSGEALQKESERAGTDIDAEKNRHAKTPSSQEGSDCSQSGNFAQLRWDYSRALEKFERDTESYFTVIAEDQVGKAGFEAYGPAAERSPNWKNEYDISRIASNQRIISLMQFYDKTDLGKKTNIVAELKSSENLCWNIAVVVQQLDLSLKSLAGVGGCGIGHVRDGVPYLTFNVRSEEFSNSIGKMGLALPPHKDLIYYDLKTGKWLNIVGSGWVPLSNEETKTLLAEGN